MTDDRSDGRASPVDDALRDLRDALSLEPAPGFAARVRAQVEQERADRRLRRWHLWSVVALPAAAALAIFVALRPSDHQTPTAAGRSASVAPPIVQVPAAAASAGPRIAAPALAPSRPERPNRPRGGAVMTAAAGSRPRELEVLVPDDQRIALMRLLAALREGRAVVPPGSPIVDEVTGELLVPAPIELRPIAVDPLPGTPDDGGSGKGDHR
jgi:hypothetical protein